VRTVTLPDSAVFEDDAGTGTESGAPALEVVVGDPSAEELAALVAVLSVVAQPPPAIDPPEAARVDGWAAPWRAIRAPVPLGPGAWTAGSVG
jgi:Acyl-CoA carboxylase epsilon subunit